MTRTRGKKPLFELGRIPARGALLDWRDSQHFDRWQDRSCALCDKPIPFVASAAVGRTEQKNLTGKCAEEWITANPVEARLGRFASDVQPKRRNGDDHA